jgi:hypothetical protein
MNLQNLAIVKVLERRDAASVVVAVVLALIISGFVQSLAAWLNGLIFEMEIPFRDNVLQQFFALIFELAILELLIRAYVAISGASRKS